MALYETAELELILCELLDELDLLDDELLDDDRDEELDDSDELDLLDDELLSILELDRDELLDNEDDDELLLERELDEELILCPCNETMPI